LTYLLDTNVISELRKPDRNARVAAWFDGTDSAELYVSVLVVGEIRHGIERLRHRGDEPQANVLDSWLTVLREQFTDRVLPISLSVAERWGRLSAAQTLPVVDGLLAATALEHEMTLVTREARTLDATGVRLLDPWRT
jgi:predicted nucleic acid-binding protein